MVQLKHTRILIFFLIFLIFFLILLSYHVRSGLLTLITV